MVASERGSHRASRHVVCGPRGPEYTVYLGCRRNWFLAAGMRLPEPKFIHQMALGRRDLLRRWASLCPA